MVLYVIDYLYKKMAESLVRDKFIKRFTNDMTDPLQINICSYNSKRILLPSNPFDFF